MGDYKDYRKVRNRETGEGEMSEPRALDCYINISLIYSLTFFFPSGVLVVAEIDR